MATGGAFPEVKSMLNSSWKMQQSSAVDRHEFSSKETIIAIQDVMYVRAILEGHIDAHDLSLQVDGQRCAPLFFDGCEYVFKNQDLFLKDEIKDSEV
jgi:hypothetical protein